jgi:hypothetical protein
VKPEFPFYSEGSFYLVTDLQPPPSENSTETSYIAFLSHFLPNFFLKIYLQNQRRYSRMLNKVLSMLLLSKEDRNMINFVTNPLSGEDPSNIATTEELIDEINSVISPLTGSRSIFGNNVLDLSQKIREDLILSKFLTTDSEMFDSVVNVLLRFLIPDVDPQFDIIGLEPIFGDVSTSAVTFASNRTANFFVRNIRYLGPLRLEPGALQSFSPSSEADDVGPKGEYAAVVFDANKLRPIRWWNPVREELDAGPLSVAVNHWLQHLGVAGSVTVEDAGQSGVAWQVTPVNEWTGRPLSAVGVGVSQVLPILIAGLLAPQDGLLLIEQPELHLHPRAQARLAEFFLGMSKTGRRCIVETHSEAFINQLRVALAAGTTRAGDDVAVYFASQDEFGDTKFSPIEIGPDGIIRNWPEGFFDESLLLEDRITRLAMQGRARAQ